MANLLGPLYTIGLLIMLYTGLLALDNFFMLAGTGQPRVQHLAAALGASLAALACASGIVQLLS